MPKPETFKYYQQLLGEELAKGQGQIVDLSPERVKAAIAAVEAKIKAMGPDPQNLERSREEFCARQANPQLFRDAKPDSDTIGPNGESRYNYSMRCLHECLKGAVVEAQQKLEWNNTLVRLGLFEKDENGNKTDKVSKTGGRWSVLMMKVDGSPESRRDNETVAAIYALGDGVLKKDEFIALRKTFHIENSKMSPADAEAMANKDFNRADEILYNEVNRRIDEHINDMPRCRDAALAIQTGDYSKFPGGMEQAFGYFRQSSGYLAMTGQDIIGFLQDKLKTKMDRNMLHDKAMDWQTHYKPATATQVISAQAANPYFAFFDPYKCDYTALSNLTQGEPVNPNDGLAYSFVTDIVPFMTNVTMESAEYFNAYNINAFDEIAAERLGNIRVYSHEGRTAIVRVTGPNADHFANFTEDPADAIRIAVRGGLGRAGELFNECARWSTTSRTSREFENMRAQLGVVKDLVLDEHSDAAAIAKAAAAVEELSACVQAYFDRKERYHTGSEYEQERINFANRVKEFVAEKQRRFNLYYENVNTKEEIRLAQEDVLYHPEWKKQELFEGLTPLQSVMLAERQGLNIGEERACRNALARQEEILRALPEETRTAMQRGSADDAKKLDDAIANAEPNPNAIAMNADDAIKAVGSLAEEAEKQCREFLSAAANAGIFAEEGWEAEAKKAEQDALAKAKYAIALYGIFDVLSAENFGERNHICRGLPGKFDTRMLRLVNCGKVGELANLICSSEYFLEYFNLKFPEGLTDREKTEQAIIDMRPCSDLRSLCFGAAKATVNGMEALNIQNNPNEIHGEEREEEINPERNPKNEEPEQKQPENLNEIHDEEPEEEINPEHNPKVEEPEQKPEQKEQENPNEIHDEEPEEEINPERAPKIEEPEQKPEQKKEENPNRIIEEDEPEEEINPENEEPEQKKPTVNVTADDIYFSGRIDIMSSRYSSSNDDVYDKAMEKIKNAIADKQESYRRGGYSSIVEKYGLEALALSTIKCMMFYSKDKKLASIVAHGSYKVLAEMVTYNDDFKQEVKGVNLASPDALDKAINCQFGNKCGYTILEKVKAAQELRAQQEQQKDAPQKGSAFLGMQNGKA